MARETVDVFLRDNEASEMVGLGFVGNGELENDAVDGGVGITILDSGGKLGGRDEKIVNCHADVGAVVDFESDVFVDDW